MFGRKWRLHLRNERIRFRRVALARNHDLPRPAQARSSATSICGIALGKWPIWERESVDGFLRPLKPLVLVPDLRQPQKIQRRDGAGRRFRAVVVLLQPQENARLVARCR